MFWDPAEKADTNGGDCADEDRGAVCGTAGAIHGPVARPDWMYCLRDRQLYNMTPTTFIGTKRTPLNEKRTTESY